MTNEMLGDIEGWRHLFDWFEGAPNFHDSEIAELRLSDGGQESYLILNLTNALGDERRFKIQWSEPVSISLNDWHSQNVIMAMRFFAGPDEQGFEIDGSVGLSGRISAKHMVISPAD